MNGQTALGMIERCGLMAGMRGHFPPAVALNYAQALMEEGINVFELTMNSAQAVESMQAIKREFGDDAVVGMGTVLDAEVARRVLDAGTDAIIAPSFNRAVVELTHEADVLAVPGVITPTEIVDAWATGARLLKIFPIGPLGVDYFKAVRGPLDHIRFICNGGTSDQNVGDFLRAGAVACGMANWLTGDGTWPVEQVRERARILRRVVNDARQPDVIKL